MKKELGQNLNYRACLNYLIMQNLKHNSISLADGLAWKQQTTVFKGFYLKTTPSLTILANQENAHQSWQFYHHLSSLAQIILNSNHFKDSNIFFPLLINDSNHLSLLWPYEPYISHIAKEGFFLLFWFLPLFLFLICEILCFSGSRQAKHVCTGKTGWTQNVKTFLSLRKEKGNSFFE